MEDNGMINSYTIYMQMCQICSCFISLCNRDVYSLKQWPHLSKPGSPFCLLSAFVRLAKIARISMTTS